MAIAADTWWEKYHHMLQNGSHFLTEDISEVLQKESTTVKAS